MIKKLLAILWLFLIPCFSFAWQEFDLWFAEEITANTNLWHTLELQNNANFILDDEYRIIQFAWNDRYPTTRTYFWNGTWMYVLSTCQWWYSCNGSILWQWYFNYVNIVDLDSINDSITSVPEWFISISEFLENSIYYNPDKLYIWWYNDMQRASLCFWYSDINKAVCFTWDRSNWNNCWWQPQYCTNWVLSYITNSQWYSSQELEYLSSFANLSPFLTSSDSSVVPDYEFNENDDYTNQQIIEGYNAMWLTDEFCYWWFALDNIFEVWSVPEEFTWYMWWSWAFIFDIWDIYSWAYNNNYISFLRSFYISYENNNYSDFYGKTKGLYWFINQWFSVSSKWLGFLESTVPTFTLVDVWQYCDIRFNQNPDSLYTWNRRDPKYRYYTSWQVNLWGYFNFSWNNNYFSWNLSWFNTPKDFFASLNAIFQWWLDNLENREPVLPTYIIVFFLAIILIRIISH